MIDELREFRDLVDKADTYKIGRGVPPPPGEEEIARCLQIMLARQCIYPWMHGIESSYRTLSTPEYQDFFRKYFVALGLRFYHDTRSGMVALKVKEDTPRYDWQAARLKKDETCVLLALRLMYDEELKRGNSTERGTVEVTTNDLYDKLQVIAKIEVPDVRLQEILHFMRRKGVVDIGERDPVDRVLELNILPGVEIAVSPAYVEHVRIRVEIDGLVVANTTRSEESLQSVTSDQTNQSDQDQELSMDPAYV
jgi:hypothetical protein